jgi:AcrR family transcriptional regulator
MRNRAGLETQAKILEATRGLLSEMGLDGVTIKGICDRAGVRAGSFYNLFESKEQVVLTIVRQAITGVDPDPEGAGTESEVDLVGAYVRFILEQPQLARVYFLVALSGGLTDPTIQARVVRHHQERLHRFTAAHLRRRPGLAEETATRRMEALLAALNGYALQFLIDTEFDLAGHVETLLALEAEIEG